jgi:hypothetical protein
MKSITKTSLSVVALAVIFAGGCSLNRQSEPVSLVPEDIASTSTTDVVASASTEVVIDSMCVRIEDAYDGPLYGSYPEWLLRLNKYPISEKYFNLKTKGENIGEGDDSIMARFFTANDCGEQQTEHLIGEKLTDQIPTQITFELSSPSAELLDLLNTVSYKCSIREDDRRWHCVMSPDDTKYSDWVKLKSFTSYIKNVVEQG